MVHSAISSALRTGTGILPVNLEILLPKLGRKLEIATVDFVACPSIRYVSGILFLCRSLPYISILFQDHAQFNGVIIAVEAGMNIA